MPIAQAQMLVPDLSYKAPCAEPYCDHSILPELSSLNFGVQGSISFLVSPVDI